MKLLRLAPAVTTHSERLIFTSARHRLVHFTMSSNEDRYSIADQPVRFAKAKKEDNKRYLDITTVYDGSFLRGKRVAITGANRGVGLSLATEVAEQGGKVVGICRSGSKELDALHPDEVVTGVDVTDDEMCDSLPQKIKGGSIDIVSKSYCLHDAICTWR